jgi:hypothetical protein
MGQASVFLNSQYRFSECLRTARGLRRETGVQGLEHNCHNKLSISFSPSLIPFVSPANGLSHSPAQAQGPQNDDPVTIQTIRLKPPTGWW